MSFAPRDPAFWKRFSVAVHKLEDEESIAASSPGGRPKMEHSDSWLARQHQKKKKRTYMCCAFWLLFLLFVAGVVVVIIWLIQSGTWNRIKIQPEGGATEYGHS